MFFKDIASYFVSLVDKPIELAAYIVSIVGYTLFALASALKRKKNILLMQSTANFICGTAEVMIHAWSGLVQDVINLLRNIFVLKNWMNKVLSIIFILAGFLVGMLVFIFDFKNAGWWGILPVIATTEFSIIIILPKVEVPVIKISLMVSSICWAIYGIGIQFYTTTFFNTISLILAITSLIAYYSRGKKKEDILPLEEEKEE